MLAPRADKAVPASVLGMYERMGWWAQLKMNGTYSVLRVVDGVVVDTRNRHDEPHRAWKLTEDSAMIWREVPEGDWVFCAELLHSKVPGIRDTHYIHDVVRREGKDLLGTTYESRYEMLLEVFGHLIGEMSSHYYTLDANTWLAKNHKPGEDYKKLFESLSRPEEEGLVLKNPKGVLHPSNNNGWTVKCRRPFKNASF